MKIAIVNQDFDIGGAQNMCVSLAEGLVSRFGYKVDLIDFLGNFEVAYVPRYSISIITNRYKRTFFEKSLAIFNKRRFKLLKKTHLISPQSRSRIKGLSNILKKNQYQVVILSQGYLTAMLPELKKSFPGVKFIAWQHSSYEAYIKTYYAAYIDEYLQGIRVADRVVCLTKQDEPKFKELNTKSVCIYNFSNIMHEKRSKLENKNVLIVARIAIHVKGLDYLLEIIQKTNPNYQFFLAGDGPDREKFEELILEKGLQNRLKLLGSLNKDELSRYYERSVMLISPSRWEGFPLVLIEAMSFGLPIISFAHQGAKEIIKNNEYGILIENFNVEEFSFEIESLIEDSNRLKEYQLKSLERAKDFDISTSLKKWKEIIDFS